MRIAIDAMGGDHAPEEVVRGTLEAATRFPDATMVLVGQTPLLEPLLDGARPANLELSHADETVAMDDDPARAVRRKRNSSINVACKMVADGAAQAVFSAGNTGALAAAAALHIGRIPGVARPCIATLLPSKRGRVVICDAGASVDSKARWVYQFGVMGAIYAEEVEGVKNPRVGLLNIGEEASKGNALARAAHRLFEEADLNWVGNVDGKDTFRGVADVIACDGFDGNLVLKVSEGAADLFVHLTRNALLGSLRTKLGAWLCKPGFNSLREVIDYAEYGGAFLLGVRGLVVIGHGRSHAKAVFNAIRRTREGIAHNVVERIQARFAADNQVAADDEAEA